MKKILVLALCFAMMAMVSVAAAADGFSVSYEANECLAEVPTDETVYAAGDEVTVLFDPVAYKDYLIFYGWDMNDDGIADFGYNYNTFTMPEENVTLKAICIGAYGYYGAPACPECHLHGTPRYWDNGIKLIRF